MGALPGTQADTLTNIGGDNLAAINEADAAIEKINNVLPLMHELSTSDAELDEISALATQSFTDLIALGMNVEARYAGTFLTTASTMLGHSITAKQAKINKKLSLIDLQLKQRKLDMQADKDTPAGTTISGEAVVLDRNALLKMLTDVEETDSPE